MMQRVFLWVLTFTFPAFAEVKPKELEASVLEVAEIAHETTVAILLNGGASGSGVVVSPDGYLLTAGHVVTSLSTGEVLQDEVKVIFEDGEERRAQVLGVHRGLDAAVLKLFGEGPWPYAALGPSERLRPGDWVVATGHPEGYDPLKGISGEVWARCFEEPGQFLFERLCLGRRRFRRTAFLT